MADIRKIVTVVAETCPQDDGAVERRAVVVLVVVGNPRLATGSPGDLKLVVGEVAEQVSAIAFPKLRAALGAPPLAYGKAALVGLKGRLEDGGTLARFLASPDEPSAGSAREAEVPAVILRAGAGTTFHVPLARLIGTDVGPHHEDLEVRVADAPRADEVLLAVVAAAAQGGSGTDAAGGAVQESAR